MNAISPRSLLPNFPASGWSSARTRYWPRSGRASARICCRPPKWHWPSWPPRSPAAPAPEGRTRSRAPSAASKTATSSPSCSTSPSPKTASALPATPPASPPKPSSTAFTSSVPAWRTKPWRPTVSSAPTRTSAHVERAFRSLKTVDLHLRPIYHWLAPRVRAHVFLCMLACHVEWHMRERLKSMLFDDEDPIAAARARASRRRPGSALTSGAAKARQQNHCQWPPRQQLPEPDARPRHLHAQRDDHHAQRRLQFYAGRHADADPGPSLPPARCRSDQAVASNRPRPADIFSVVSTVCVCRK